MIFKKKCSTDCLHLFINVSIHLINLFFLPFLYILQLNVNLTAVKSMLLFWRVNPPFFRSGLCRIVRACSGSDGEETPRLRWESAAPQRIVGLGVFSLLSVIHVSTEGEVTEEEKTTSPISHLGSRGAVRGAEGREVTGSSSPLTTTNQIPAESQQHKTK